ncbi:UDP-N-acetylglucosamine 2-epimerase [Halothiobacillus sp. DCM-1]|uniref:UDP-N-acetylglucosamine 2-epimerase n=1 Tax=Halothiobacillus sp. DCM-1 TaxID=3112558 RepID=UPI00324CBC64
MRRIAVITSTRADYGLLYWLLREIDAAADLQLQLIVTGTHLMPLFGQTEQGILADGFTPAARIALPLESDEPLAVAEAMGVATSAFARAFATLSPDIVVILGDRFEMLSAATAAFTLRIPIAHIHGGEVTEGALDEGYRHAISKLSALHFAAAEPYRQRLIRMGELPDRVWTVGAPGLDHLTRSEFLSAEALTESLGLDVRRPTALVTFHPATLDTDDAAAQCTSLLAALAAFPDWQFVLTHPNADPGGRAILPLLDAFAREDPARRRVFSSLGQARYLSLLRQVPLVIGNSSSGIIEAPSFGTATVNVGDRQHGRLRAASIIDCPVDTPAIISAIRTAIAPAFQARLATVENPYGAGNAAAKMLAVLRSTPLAPLRRKPFFDWAGKSQEING